MVAGVESSREHYSHSEWGYYHIPFSLTHRASGTPDALSLVGPTRPPGWVSAWSLRSLARTQPAARSGLAVADAAGRPAEACRRFSSRESR